MINTVTGVSVTEMIADLAVADYCERMENHGKRKTIEEIERIEHDLWDGEPTTWKQLCDEHDIENIRPSDRLHTELFTGAHKDKVRIVLDTEAGKKYMLLDPEKGATYIPVETMRKLSADTLQCCVRAKLIELGYYRCVDPNERYVISVDQWLTKTLDTGSVHVQTVDHLTTFSDELIIQKGAVDSDTYGHKYGVGSGVVDADCKGFMTHAEAFAKNILITKRLAVDAVGKAELATEFLTFIEWMTQGDAGLARYIRLAFGAALVGDFNDETIFYLHGNGNNGKGVLLRLMAKIFGDYGQHTTSKILMEAGQRNSSADRDGQLKNVMGAKLWTVAEVKEGQTLNDELLKSLKDGGQYRGMRENAEFMAFKGMLIIGGNHEPRCADNSNGMRRRMKFIPCLGQKELHELDRDLEDRLFRNEAEHILAWVIEGATDYIELGRKCNGIPPLRNPEVVPVCVIEKTEAYWGKQDYLGDFLREHFRDYRLLTQKEREVRSSGVSFQSISRAYTAWLEENDEGSKAERQKVTATALRESVPPKLKQLFGWELVPERVGKDSSWGLKITGIPEGHFLASGTG